MENGENQAGNEDQGYTGIRKILKYCGLGVEYMSVCNLGRWEEEIVLVM